ncbi:hypothetical protein DLAC_07857 [Tieghemostelium lacteum]|uniref:Glycosyltransferase n=1 Tax=Tieghemostelium lacteum TaxID=361077 RepID=A0A151ZAJ8_TIELA|nr:hypothetical protein DLAC_07857 [Tieghemostelium lacteum]|eukprot:KYQ90970.1 hypothetical protein DLAC_07857 [Tieghemostelium lacteum]
MAFKRVEDFKLSLDSLIKANYSQDYHLVITQSISLGDRSHYIKLHDFINNVDIKNKFKSITHIETESKSSLPFGNAYHAFKNMVRGMVYVWEKFSALDSLIIIEEDIVVSEDIFEFFEKSRNIINQDPSNSIRLATSAYFLHTTHSYYDWRLDKPIKRKTIRNELSLSLLNPKQIDQVKLQGEIEFKVLAWMLHKSIAKTIIDDFNQQIQPWVLENGENIIENKPFTPKPEILKNNCDCWNHDRYLELRFRDFYFLGSQSPRCNHVPSGGVGLSHPGEDYGFPLNENYTSSDEFYIGVVNDGEKGIWGLVKEYLPDVECPNRIDCNHFSTGNKCGSIYNSTCLNIWNLECIPCSGRKVETFQPICNEKFPQCCDGVCNATSPFFINIPTLFKDNSVQQKK